ncbi:cyclic nucleotide-binding domain-containing protein [Niabella yanshanensis]|uniref:Cyclic nucleotide-binding domain-containing protein n=1 Tax=Niabella yanshanensis TaxID=577386 RepID=A0ABZ0WAK8_9BACT|nr:cyclic nucleotide-binding domain-containing protein [Niabella yanshanensis]WQD39180.1 cyclic nucleotide-binding domain-containing protein [Niabella yanshanensis]
MTNRLVKHIQNLLPDFTAGEKDLSPFITTRVVKKDEILLRENEPCDALYFVARGCLYLYYEHHAVKQVIHFALENWWITDYKTFAMKGPAVYSIAAMEDSELIVINRQQYEALLNQYPMVALYFNTIHERAYGAALLKQKTYATTTKEDFYKYFKNTYPDILARIPDPIFASYMQVNLEELVQLKQSGVS